jgi:tetratricopeptide (TPR) repeat protein
MPYQQEEETILRQRLSKKAVDLAVQGRWEEAEAVNRDIIEKFPADVEAYNRLGRALTELRKFAQAKEAYLKALELAPNNAIASKNLARLANLPEPLVTLGSEHHQITPVKERSQRVAPEFFTAEMGKTGVVRLCDIASEEVLAKTGAGVQVYLNVRGQHLVVENEGGEYLGEVEPKQGLRLIKLIEGGNRYAAAILSYRGNEVQVFMREVYQHPSQVGRPSFIVKPVEHLRPLFHPHPSPLPSRERGGEIEAIEAMEEPLYPEEEEYLEEEEESVPEGFSVLDEDGEEKKEKEEEEDFGL